MTFAGKAQIADTLGFASHEVSTKLLSSAAVAGKPPWTTCKQMGMAGSNKPLFTTLWRQVEETADFFFFDDYKSLLAKQCNMKMCTTSFLCCSKAGAVEREHVEFPGEQDRSLHSFQGF